MMTLVILPYGIKLIVSQIIWLLSTVIFIASLASWIPQVRYSKIGEMLHMLTEPIVGPVRRMLQRIPSVRRLPIDLAPLATYLILILIGQIIWLL